MTDKSEWQEANRRLIDEERRKLGDPPTAEEMMAYCRGQLPESEEERIRELLVAYPELARVYGAEIPPEPRPGDPDAVSDEEMLAGWTEFRQRLGGSAPPAPRDDRARRTDGQRGRLVIRHYIPTTIAAAFALVFFALFVQAESRARYHEREGHAPRVVGEPQELEPGGRRGGAAPTMLRLEGEGYLVRLRLFLPVQYPHYSVELQDGSGQTLWINNTAKPGQDKTLQIFIPRDFLSAGTAYQLRVFGLDGDTRPEVGAYDVAVPAE